MRKDVLDSLLPEEDFYQYLDNHKEVFDALCMRYKVKDRFPVKVLKSRLYHLYLVRGNSRIKGYDLRFDYDNQIMNGN